MAVAVGHKSTNTNAIHTGASSLTLAHDCTGDTDLIVVVTFANTQGSVTSITYAGNAMTLIANPSVSGQIGIYVYHLASPPTGSNNISASFSGASQGSGLNGISFSGSNSVGANTTTTGSSFSGSSPVALTRTLNTGDMLLGIVADNSGGGAPTSSDTLQWGNADGNWMDNGGATATGSGSVSIHFSSTRSANYAMCAVPIIAAASAVTHSLGTLGVGA